jgi:PAS domain S-box-containing protein
VTLRDPTAAAPAPSAPSAGDGDVPSETLPQATLAQAAPAVLAQAALAQAALAQLAEGVIVTDAAGRITFVNEAAARLHGVARLDVAPEAYADTYHLLTEGGDPYPSAELPLARAVLRGETVTEVRWRIGRPDRTEVLAVGSARPVLGPDGARLGAVLTVRDDTARAAAVAELEAANQQLQEQAAELEATAEELQATAAHLEEQTEAADRARAAAEAARARTAGVLEAVADAYFALDADFRITEVNAAMARGSGLARDRLLGRDFWEAFPGAVGTAFERHYRAAATERVDAHFTHDYSDGRLDLVVEVDAYPAEGGGIAVFWRDVTVRARGIADRERLLAAERAARAAAEAAAARAGLLQDLTAALSHALTREQVAAVVVERVSTALGAHLGVLALMTPEGDRLAVAAAERLRDDTWHAWATFPLDAPVPLAEAARAGRPVVLPTFDAIAAHAPSIADLCRDYGTEALCAVPVVGPTGRVIGTFGLSFPAPRPLADEVALWRRSPGRPRRRWSGRGSSRRSTPRARRPRRRGPRRRPRTGRRASSSRP